MINFIKNLFAPKNSFDDYIDELIEGSKPWIRMGAEIGYDCFENGLKKGYHVKVSDIERQIRKEYPQSGEVVINGFLNMMKEYMEKGLVISFSVEGGDTLLLHKDHVDNFLKANNLR